MTSDPSEDYVFHLSYELIDDKEIDVDERGAEIRVIVELEVRNRSTWALEQAVVALGERYHDSAALENLPGHDEFCDLDVGSLQEGIPVVVHFVVRTGQFANSQQSAEPGWYEFPFRVIGNYRLVQPEYQEVMQMVMLPVEVGSD